MNTPKDYEVFGARIFPFAVPPKAGVAPRPAPRLPCHGLVEVRAGLHSLLGVLSDVSATGAFVWMDHGPEVGARVELALLHSGGEFFRCGAKVVRQGPDGVALVFDAASEALPGLVAANELA